MKENGRALVEALHREAQECLRDRSAPGLEPRTIHYTELPEEDSASPLGREWNTYRRAVKQLLADGHKGRFALVKDEAIIGLFDTCLVSYWYCTLRG